MQNLFGSGKTQVAKWDSDREEKAPNKGHGISQVTYHSGQLGNSGSWSGTYSL